MQILVQNSYIVDISRHIFTASSSVFKDDSLMNFVIAKQEDSNRNVFETHY